jgi:hypothetical protein
VVLAEGDGVVFGDGDGVGLATLLERAVLDVLRLGVAIADGPTFAK